MIEKCAACSKKCGNKIPKHNYCPVGGNDTFCFILCDKCFSQTAGRETLHVKVKDQFEKMRIAGLEKRRENAKEFYSVVYPIINKMKEEGSALQSITDALNTLGYRTRKGKPWNITQVVRVLNICSPQNFSSGAPSSY